MSRRALKSFKKMTIVFLWGVGAIVFMGVSPALADAPLSTAVSWAEDLPYLLLFFFLTVCLISWMLWDRIKLKKKLTAEYHKNHYQYLLLKSRKGVSLVWDETGVISSVQAVKDWFGLTPDGQEAACRDMGFLRDPDLAFTDEQYDVLLSHTEKLLTYGESFRKKFLLQGQHRNIVVRGEVFRDDQNDKRSIIWFREATIEENIAAFQDKDDGFISDRLDFFETTSNLMHLPMWLRDENLKLIWVNDAYVDSVEGETEKQVITDGLELITGTIGKTAQHVAAAARKSDDAYSEKHFVVIRGERRAVEIHNMPLQISKNQRGYLGYAQDITALENARGELIHHMESHSETLNKLSTAVAIFTSGKRLEYYNSAFSRLWHLPEKLLFSHPHHGEVLEAMRDGRRLPEQANFPEWKAAQLEAYTQLLEPVEEMWHLPDNTSLRVVTQPHPLGGLLVFYEDVTDHFALERSYNTLFAVQRATLNNLHEGIAVFGIDGCLQLYNEAFAGIWGLSRDMLDANPHTADVMDACVSNYGSGDQIQKLKNLIVGGEMKKELSSGQLNRRDNSVLNYSAVPLPDGAMLITFVDVSDSLAIERVLRQRNQALEEADKIKADFLAHMSYELRTPLNSIIGFSELLEKEYQGPLNDVQHDYMHSILSASGQLLELFNDILDLSFIEAGGLTLDIGEFDVADVVAQVVDQLQERIKVKDIDLAVICSPELTSVWGDSKRIQHAIYNLLSNAVKFTPLLGSIKVTVLQDVLNYKIVIQDSGVGIKQEEVDNIFEKFFTGSNVHNEQGAGLGLSLVKNFIELHEGKTQVQSKLNVGTKVTLSLPNRVGQGRPIRVTDASGVRRAGI